MLYGWLAIHSLKPFKLQAHEHRPRAIKPSERHPSLSLTAMSAGSTSAKLDQIKEFGPIKTQSADGEMTAVFFV